MAGDALSLEDLQAAIHHAFEDGREPVALLLRGHHPFYGSPLRLISGPERIESGWWDGALVLRDYFVAEGEEGACYWIYRERDAGSARWFLHGLFA